MIGIISTLTFWVVINSSDNTITESRQCMTQKIHFLNANGESSPYLYSIGEAVICGRDWKISNIHGPDVESFYGEIKLRDLDAKEFIEERE